MNSSSEIIALLSVKLGRLFFSPYSVIICKFIVFRDIEECNGDSHVYMIQFDHVNGEPLKKETCRSTFVYVVQTLSDWSFKFDI